MQAQVSKTLECTAGHLTDSLTSGEKDTITNLTITGTIDARDFKTMRDSMPVLAVLDASGATVATYTGTLGTADTSSITYPAYAIPARAFFDPNTGMGKISLTSITMPSSDTAVGNAAFVNCTGLTSAVIPSLVTTIGTYAFEYCTKLTSVDIPSLVTTIGTYAFAYCSGLLTISIPSSVTSMGFAAFAGNSGLFTVAPDNPNYSSSDGVLFNKTQGSLIQCPTLKTGSYTIPSSVNSIGGFAFLNCIGLTSVTIPSSVNTINGYAFRNCNGLTSVTIPPSVTFIGYAAFFVCNGLTSVTIPSSVIGSYAFNGCIHLSSITLLSSVTSIGDNAFGNCNHLVSINVYDTIPIDLGSSPNVFNYDTVTKIILYVPAGSLSAYQAANQWSAFTNIVEYALTVSSATASIGKEANSKDSVDVTSNTAWTANSDETWLTVNPDSGIGNGKLVFIAEANPAITTRTATVTISAMGVSSKTITITQDAAAITLSVSASTASVAKEANSKDSVDVTSNTAWTAISNKTWLAVSPGSGTGNGKLIFTAGANSAITTRSATITVSAAGVTSKTITVTQDAGTGTGITNATKEFVNLYPNPVKDILYLSTVDGVKQVEIINIEGHVIANLKNISSKSINVSNLDKGVYLFRITTESSTLLKKIVKE